MTQGIEYKGYHIVGDGTYGHKKITTIGKGSLPLQLRGSFTTSVFARKAIDGYLSEKGSKEA